MSSTPITLLDVQLSTIYNDYSHLGFSPSNLIDNSFTTSAATAVSSSGPSANWAAVRLSPTDFVGLVEVYNRRDMYQPWLSSISVWLGSTAGDRAVSTTRALSRRSLQSRCIKRYSRTRRRMLCGSL